MPDQNQPPAIEEFRKIISGEYLSKGLVPPLPSSPEELALYNLYIKGWQSIHSLNDHR